MSFIDNAMEVLGRTEASLHAVISDALAAKAYKEIAAIAAMAEAVAAISAGYATEARRAGVAAADRAPASERMPAVEIGMGLSQSGTETPKPGEPSWMRPKS
jgi:hypothetical protein